MRSDSVEWDLLFTLWLLLPQRSLSIFLVSLVFIFPSAVLSSTAKGVTPSFFKSWSFTGPGDCRACYLLRFHFWSMYHPGLTTHWTCCRRDWCMSRSNSANSSMRYTKTKLVMIQKQCSYINDGMGQRGDESNRQDYWMKCGNRYEARYLCEQIQFVVLMECWSCVTISRPCATLLQPACSSSSLNHQPGGHKKQTQTGVQHHHRQTTSNLWHCESRRIA